MRKITNYDQFLNILPYASEMFGVYQPLIGWKSKRKIERARGGLANERAGLFNRLKSFYRGVVDISFNADHVATVNRLLPGEPATPAASPQNLILMKELSAQIKDKPMLADEDWRGFLNYDLLDKLLNEKVFPVLRDETFQVARAAFVNPAMQDPAGNRLGVALQQRTVSSLQNQMIQRVNDESAMAGVLLGLVDNSRFDLLRQLFYLNSDVNYKDLLAGSLTLLNQDYTDPYLTFDPKKDIKDVSLSPVGIVHLFRQYFFEFDSFLGTPTAHVWLSPGSTVELIEISTRRTITERTIETSLESVVKTERSTTDQDEISDAVKQDNKDDLKLGVSTTVNQSWGTGNATATASLNMDKTQQVARENTHKRMRQQTEKLSSEIRENYKTTLKTITDVTDTTSKRYLLTNTTQALINYELRRKMRQVGIQVQDIGTYLCWETFVDDPGKDLGLANLVNLAQPADVLPQPDQHLIPYPPDKNVPFQTSVVWDFDDDSQNNNQHPEVNYRFVPITVFNVPPGPDSGYEVKPPDDPEALINIFLISLSGEDSQNQRYAFRGKFINGYTQIWIGVDTGNHGIEWDNRIDFVVGGTITYGVSAAKRAEIDTANSDKIKAKEAADREYERKQKEAFIKAAKDRIKLSSEIKQRKFEELREEERIMVYRNLIASLLTSSIYQYTDNQSRHTLSELINSIFDVDKMLYFVAPEWWKPRVHEHQGLGINELSALDSDSLVNWSDLENRTDNYFITEDSIPARMGSSLGWLLQLDGDNLRNAFLNAPWVKAVIPIRPGKEQAAIHWLQSVNVEGADGLDAEYAAPPDELNEIRSKLLESDPNDEVKNHPAVTINDAIRYLCEQVAIKYTQSVTVDRFPKGVEIHDDDKVNATPVEKVYEHGFYPLQGGFRINPNQPDPNNPDKNFQVFDQWVEVLPTDQIVPVEVAYDPKTGRML